MVTSLLKAFILALFSIAIYIEAGLFTSVGFTMLAIFLEINFRLLVKIVLYLQATSKK